MNARRVFATSLLLTTLACVLAVAGAGNSSPQAVSESTVCTLYQHLIEAENAHDIEKVRSMVWDSPSALFVAKTKTAAEGNWAGFWARRSSSITSRTFSQVLFESIPTTPRKGPLFSAPPSPRPMFRFASRSFMLARAARQSPF
jgi:hypothetical protein